MATVIPAKDVGRVIYEEMAAFAQEQYGEKGQEFLAAFLDSMSFSIGTD